MLEKLEADHGSRWIGEGCRCFFFRLALSWILDSVRSSGSKRMHCDSGRGAIHRSRLRAIFLENEAEYLFCTPTYALRLIETAKELELSLKSHSLKKIIVAGECGGSVPEIRNAIDQAWGGKSLFFDHYGMMRARWHMKPQVGRVACVYYWTLIMPR